MRVQAMPMRRPRPLNIAECQTADEVRERAARAASAFHTPSKPVMIISRAPKKQNPLLDTLPSTLLLPRPARIRRPRDWLIIQPSSLVVDMAPSFAWKTILFEVAEAHGISPQDIISQRRSHNIVLARHEYCWRLRSETPLSLEAIGRRCGNRDHTTIRNAIAKHELRNAVSANQVRRVRAIRQDETERDMIMAMIREGASNYAIRIEMGVGRLKVQRIRKEMQAVGL